MPSQISPNINTEILMKKAHAKVILDCLKKKKNTFQIRYIRRDIILIFNNKIDTNNLFKCCYININKISIG